MRQINNRWREHSFVSQKRILKQVGEAIDKREGKQTRLLILLSSCCYLILHCAYVHMLHI